MIYIIIICIILLLIWLYHTYGTKKIPFIATQYIPKVIIQTWKSNNIPDKYKPLIDSIKTNNPDYEYKFFTDEDIDVFLKANYPQYYDTYQKIPIKIQKIDFFRYVAVYHYGGIYMDLDMKGLKNMDDMLSHPVVFPVDEYITKEHGQVSRYKSYYDNNQRFLLGQYAFAAEPKNGFIKELIDNIHNNINKIVKSVNHDDDEYVYKTTGPDFVTTNYMKSSHKKNVFILDNGKRQYFGDYAQHKYFGSWK